MCDILADVRVGRDAVIAVVRLADDEGQLLADPRWQDAVGQGAAEAEVGLKDRRRDGHRTGHVRDDAELGLHGVEQLLGGRQEPVRAVGELRQRPFGHNGRCPGDAAHRFAERFDLGRKRTRFDLDRERVRDQVRRGVEPLSERGNAVE